MIIANPIFDVVFKHLMRNKKNAKFFISTLIEEEVISIDFYSQEIPLRGEALSLLRLDFVAVIKTEDGVKKKVLIEIQKASNFTDIMRFRRYLAKHYEEQEESPLEIIAVYILGFELPLLESAAIKVQREYKDLIAGKILPEAQKSEFADKLTHECYIVQIPRIKSKKMKTRLELLLSVFEQTNFIDPKHKRLKDYTHDIKDKGVLSVVTDLHSLIVDPEIQKQIADELEAVRVIELEKRAAKKEAQKELESELAQRDEIIHQQGNQIAELKRMIEKLKKK
jgi:hypothetical protein